MNRSHNSLKTGILSLVAAVALPFAVGADATAFPTPKKTVAPSLSPNLRDAAGEVRVLVDINAYGFVTDAVVQDSTNEALNKAALDAIHQWTFAPATENGAPIASKAVQPFYFNGGSIVMESKKAPDDTHPVAKRSVKPSLGPDLRNVTGEVVLQADVDASGRVASVAIKSSTHRELEGPAAEALARWSFRPAVSEGQAVASKVVVPFHFNGSGEETAQTVARANRVRSVDRAPIVLRQLTPELPTALQQERGEAKLQLAVDEHGYVAGVTVLESSNDILSAAASEAALQWKFRPALKDGAPTASTVIQPFSFNGGLIAADLPADSMPKVKRSLAPKLPEALTQVQGFVKVRLNLDEQGRVVDASATKSSHDELVAPTLEAAKGWTFKPAVRDGAAVPSSVIVPFVFNERG